MSQDSKRFCFVDNLYTIGILLVLIGHSHSSDWSTFSGTILEKIIGFIYTFHMPLFFFVAGFLLMNSHSIEKQGYMSWVKNKGVKLLTPYLVLSAIVAVPKYYLENRCLAGIGKHLMMALFQPRLTVWGHFWFIPVLFLLYVIFGYMKYKGLMEGKKVVFQIVSAFILYMLPISTLWFGLSDFKTGALFFVVGALFFQIRLEERHDGCVLLPVRLACIVAGTVISFVLWKQNLHSGLLNLLIALLMIFVCYHLAVLIGKNNVTSWISKHNFTIYIYSWPFQAVVMMLCDRLHWAWYMTFCTMFAVGFAAPIVMIEIYEKCGFLHCKLFDDVFGIKA